MPSGRDDDPALVPSSLTWEICVQGEIQQQNIYTRLSQYAQLPSTSVLAHEDAKIVSKLNAAGSALSQIYLGWADVLAGDPARGHREEQRRA